MTRGTPCKDTSSCNHDKGHLAVYCFRTCVLVCSVLGEFPTEPVTREAHPYPPQMRARRTFRYRRPVRSRVAAVLEQHLQQCRTSHHVTMTRGTPCKDTSSCNHDKGHLAGTPHYVMMTRGTPCKDTSSCNHDNRHLAGTPHHVMMTRGTPCKDTSSCNHDKGHLAGTPHHVMMINDDEVSFQKG
ncbi:hypothetical protein Taro_037094 [Colocasia esculenta]|uniref:Uncharacterized protein n=1 Tax=Colocasia esculenta TaxID=4460 RepID=A0A843W8Q6_COLES|nr:hypothetical protein [Colocasia esculenta]